MPGLAPATENEQLLAFVRTIPEIAESGISHGSVWTVFTDGVQLAIVNNVPASSGLRAAAPTRARAPSAAAAILPLNLPASTQARVLDTFGPGFHAEYNEDPAILPALLAGHGYVVIGTDASAEALKTVDGDGVFIISTHGTYLRTGYALMTTTRLIDPTFEEANLSEFMGATPGLVYATPRYDQDPATGEYQVATFVGITSHFIRNHHWRFSKDSFVLLNACVSNDAEMSQALVDAGASVIAAWTEPVAIDRALATSFELTERLLGSNESFPPFDPPMRPFSWGALKPLLDGLGYTSYEDKEFGHGELTFLQNGAGGAFGALAPSISFMTMDEFSDQLEINGAFGANPGAGGQVTVGGVPAAVTAWEPYQLKVRLPRSGAGAAGDVVVSIFGSSDPLPGLVPRKSNVVQLSEWRGDVRLRASGPESFLQSETYRVHLRADVHELRESPEATPAVPDMVMFSLAFDSTASFLASGSHTFTEYDPPITESWSGTAERGRERDLDGGFSMDGALQLAARTMVAVPFNGDAMFTVTVNGASHQMPFSAGVRVVPPFKLGPRFGIEAGFAETVLPAYAPGSGIALVNRMEWDAIPNLHPPDPNAAR